jgi:uncharacterized protein YecE (DUF72 family)
MNKGGKGILRIGTSNIVTPFSKEFFPDAFKDKSRLNYYSSIFNTVELNSTFKKIPRLSTFEKWADDVPQGFQFTNKVSKEITHVKNLNAEFRIVKSFISAANHLGNKKGCLLIQFPEKITAEYREHVEKIILNIQRADTKNEWRRAVEFRSSTWYTERTKFFLHHYNATLVLHDMPKSANLNLDETASFHYFRFHGPTGDYKGSYSDEFLEQQALTIKALLIENKDVYAYFNNTMGDAFKNAITLEEKVEKLIRTM